MTLKELWEQQGYTPTQLAGQSGISVPTLYKMNRKDRVAPRTIDDVCRVLDITRQDYQNLEADK